MPTPAPSHPGLPRSVCLIGLALVLANTPPATARPETTVEIVGEQGRGLARVADLLAPITGPDWLSQPSSLSVISVPEGRALGAQRMVDLMQADPSVELNYAPAGYYESLQVRGFAVDPVLGYRINGLPVVGEVPFWMRPFEALEFVRGPVGAWLGGGAGGGLVNLVSLRPWAQPGPGQAFLDLQSHGGLAIGLDQGLEVSGDTRARLTAELGRLRSGAPGVEGQAQGVALSVDSGVGDWQLELDLQNRRQSQITQPGAQLLAGRALPPVRPDLALGLSDWSEPTVFLSQLAQLRLSRGLSGVAPGWQTQIGLSGHRVRTDDRSSFPWGCSNGIDPYFLFCGNGDFTLWDYQSLRERRSMHAAQANAYGPMALLGVSGIASLGLSVASRETQLPSYSWQTTDAGLVDSGNVFTGRWSGQPLPAAPYQAFRAEVRQKSAWLSWTAHSAQARGVQPSVALRTVQFDQGFESAFWTARPWTTMRESRLLGAVGLSLSLRGRQRISLGWREDLEAGQRVPVTAANDGELLPPRRVTATELGYKWDGPLGARIALTAFYSERPYDLRRDEQPVPIVPGPYVRLGRESRVGLEWVIQRTLSSRVGLEWTGSWTDSAVDGTGLAWLDGRAVGNLPRARSRLRLERKATPGWPELQLALSGVSGRWATRGETVRVPGHSRLDAGVGLPSEWLGPALRAQLSVQNLLDRRYWADASEFLGDAYLTPGPSRTVGLQISIPL